MGKESFENLYPAIQAIADGKPLGFVGGEAARKEAAVMLQLMDGYVEPVLPFGDVTDEQIEEAFRKQEEKYGFVIWSNQMAGTDEDCARIARDETEIYLGYSEDEMRQISYENCSDEMDILRTELGMINVPGAVIEGSVGRWNGPVPVRAFMGSLPEILRVFTGDGCTLYIKDGLLKAENVHHDGTDLFTIWLLKEGADQEERGSVLSREELESPVPALDKHFGWTRKDNC